MGKPSTARQYAKARALSLAALLYPGERLYLDRVGREVHVRAVGGDLHRYIARGPSRTRAWRSASRAMRAHRARGGV